MDRKEWNSSFTYINDDADTHQNTYFWYISIVFFYPEYHCIISLLPFGIFSIGKGLRITFQAELSLRSHFFVKKLSSTSSARLLFDTNDISAKSHINTKSEARITIRKMHAEYLQTQTRVCFRAIYVYRQLIVNNDRTRHEMI